MIKAEIIADSISPNNHRIITMIVTFPRPILAEFNTHRMFSRNSASSRAIPFKKMVESVQANPFIPIAWQKDHKGMQGMEYFNSKEDIQHNYHTWLIARNHAIEEAAILHDKYGVTKQLANRLLEPFMYHTCIITATDWENFFSLRCPQYVYKVGEDREEIYRNKRDIINKFPALKEADNMFWLTHNKGQAEIHMMALAEAMWDAYNESEPREHLLTGEWHIPFIDKIDMNILEGKVMYNDGYVFNPEEAETNRVKIATAMCARVSYTTIGEEKGIDYRKLIELHDRMATQVPTHASPFEHCAKAMSEKELDDNIRMEKGQVIGHYNRNFNGWMQYRSILNL